MENCIRNKDKWIEFRLTWDEYRWFCVLSIRATIASFTYRNREISFRFVSFILHCRWSLNGKSSFMRFKPSDNKRCVVDLIILFFWIRQLRACLDILKRLIKILIKKRQTWLGRPFEMSSFIGSAETKVPHITLLKFYWAIKVKR